MQLSGTKRLKDGRQMLPAGGYSEPTENQGIMNMETGEIIALSKKDQRIADMKKNKKQIIKDLQAKVDKENETQRKPSWAEDYDVTFNKGVINYENRSITDTSRSVLPIDGVKRGKEIADDYSLKDLSFEDYLRLNDGAITHRGYVVRRIQGKSAGARALEFQREDKNTLAYVFPYAPIGGVRGGISEIDYSKKVGKVNKIRVYDEPRKYNDNGTERQTRIFGQYGRKWYPMSLFSRSYADQPAIFVPPSM
jgi:hypothetical protein